MYIIVCRDVACPYTVIHESGLINAARLKLLDLYHPVCYRKGLEGGLNPKFVD